MTVSDQQAVVVLDARGITAWIWRVRIWGLHRSLQLIPTIDPRMNEKKKSCRTWDSRKTGSLQRVIELKAVSRALLRLRIRLLT